MSNPKNIILGIDLGTTYSAMAYVDEHGDAKIIPNDNNERITPSVVYFESDSNIVVGQNAKDEAELSPERVVAFVKREMGKKKEEVRKEENYGEAKPYDFDGKIYSPEEISALILKKLKQDAEKHFNGTSIKDAVITVPAYFNDSEKTATKDAGRMAGFNVLQVINEPTAAAISYGLKSKEAGKKIFVFDLGGGTFDVTILDIKQNGEEKIIDVIDSDGDHRLGGKDWDDVIIEHACDLFINEHGEDPRNDHEGFAELRIRAEKAKKQLSEKERAKFIVSCNGDKTKVEIDRNKFEEISEDLMLRTQGVCERLMENNKLSWNDIDTVLLVGGSTRMPMVKNMLESISGKEIRNDLVQPDECVALGAAMRGMMINISTNPDAQVSAAVKEELGTGITVQDILSHSIGVVSTNPETNEDYMSFLFKRKMKIPNKVSNRFVTIAENQKGMRIDVREGESSNPNNCRKLVDKLLEFKRALPARSPVEVTFSMDHSGLLNIHALDLTDNIEIEFKVERENNLSENEVVLGMANINQLSVEG